MIDNASPMFIDYRHEKLVNAIAYFVGNTRHCHTVKLFKLLNFLDFEHYRQTGWSVTGLSYQALPMGPVPISIHEEIKGKTSEQNMCLEVAEKYDAVYGDKFLQQFKSNKKFDDTYFTPRELEIMEQLLFIFKDATADVMTKQSHSPKYPWKKIYKNGEGKGYTIPYELMLESDAIVGNEPAIGTEGLRMLDDVFHGTGLR